MQFMDLSVSEIMIVDAVGRIIRKINVSDAAIIVDLNELNSGLYSVIIKSDKGMIFRKIEILN